ncbi:MAG: hypothetical protein WC319_07665 [Candidatus Paceibacterota bacterium]
MKPTFVILLLIFSTIIASALGILTIPQIYITFGIAFSLILFMYSVLINPFRTELYHIHKGWHHSIVGFFSMFLPYVRMYNKDKHDVLFTFRLFDSCHYDRSAEGMSFWNKLCGAVMKGGVHGDSLRIAWRPSKEKTHYEVCHYAYEDGVRRECAPIRLEYGKYYYAILGKTKFSIYDSLNIEVYTKPLMFSEFGNQFSEKKYRFLLLPYFGGIPRAMKKFNIYLKTEKI